VSVKISQKNIFWKNLTWRLLLTSNAYSCGQEAMARGEWKRRTGHRETVKIVGTDLARLDNERPYGKGQHRKTPAVWCQVSRCPVPRFQRPYGNL